MLPLKLTLNNEVRRVQVHTTGDLKLSYAELVETARNLFPSLRQQDVSTLKIFYNDEDNDYVACSSDVEVTEAIRVMTIRAPACKFKIEIIDFASPKETESLPASSQAIHYGVTCDGCGMSPIQGPRFKCAVREDFDLCQTCEASQAQPHPMLKIYAKEQAPVAMFIGINDNPAGRGPTHPHHSHGRCFQQQQQSGQGKSQSNEGRKGPWGCRGGAGANPAEWNSQRRGGPWHPMRHGGLFGGRHCQGKEDFMGYWRKPQAEGGPSDELKASVAPFIAAADAAFSHLSGLGGESNPEVQMSQNSPFSNINLGSDGKSTTDAADETAQLDEQLLHEAMQESLRDQPQPVDESTNTNTNSSMASTFSAAASSAQSSATMQSAIPVPEPTVPASPSAIERLVNASLSQTQSNDKSFFTKYVPASSFTSTSGSGSFANSTPKPMARFVRDVTLPDGSSVFPGTGVTKTWRIRNDGDRDWPEGVTLQFSSGDLLAPSTESLTCPIQAIKVNEEVDISVRLSIPEATGRHVTYFRLRTKEGNIFGQRLWADVRVVEPENDWVGVVDAYEASAINATSTSTGTITGTVTAVNGQPVPVPVMSVVEPKEEQTDVATLSEAEIEPQTVLQSALAQTRSILDPVPDTASAPTTSPATTLQSGPVESAAAQQPAAASGSVPLPQSVEVWSRVWAKELSVLADMGFTDAAALIPLLQEHVGLPVSLCPELNGVPPADGMQKLVAVLLGMSGSLSF